MPATITTEIGATQNFPGTNQLTIVSYNNVIFLSTYKSQLSMRSELSQDKRTIKYVTITLKVRCLVQPIDFQDNTDSILSLLTARLNYPGGMLTLDSTGYGLYTINEPGKAMKDVKWGPIPKLLGITVHGAGVNAVIDWTVETTIPVCLDAIFENGLADFSYSYTHEQDGDGYAAISTTGKLEIPMTRQRGSNIPPDHADRYKSKIETPVPTGFRRTKSSWNYSDDRRSISFDYRDEQLREPLPPGVSMIRLRHDAESSIKEGFRTWRVTINGSIAVPPNVLKDYAARVFMGIVHERFQRARENFARVFFVSSWANGRRPGYIAAEPTAIPLGFRISNQVDDRIVEGTYSFRYFRRGSMLQVAGASGMWRPFPMNSHDPTANHNVWLQSMARLGVTKVRGPLNLVFRPQDDAIIDLCSPTVQPAPQRSGGPSNLPNIGGGGPNRPGAPPAPGAGGVPGGRGTPGFAETGAADGGDADRDTSWIHWDAQLNYQETGGRYARHKPLAGKLSEPQQKFDLTGNLRGVNQLPGGIVGSVRWDGARDIMQEVQAPPAVVYLTGQAMRVGSRIPMPNLLSLRGAKAYLNREVDAKERIVTDLAGQLVYYQSWVLEFFLDQPPQVPLPTLGDPLLGIQGGAAVQGQSQLGNARPLGPNLDGNIIRG